MVKNTRLKRHMSPRTSAMGMYHSETSTPEPPRQRRLVPRKAVPTLYVTEPDGATAKNPKWVEVEEIIEYKVNKSPKLPRRRGASPARSEREHVITPRSKRSSQINPNTNNNNNNITEVIQASPTHHCFPNTSQNLSKVENLLLNLTHEDEETNEKRSSQTTCLGQVHHPLGTSDHHTLTTENAFGGEGGGKCEEELAFIVESELETDGFSSAETLPCENHTIVLEDQDDHVPQEWEAYGKAKASSPSHATPCEVSVTQEDINEPTIGQPVLSNLDWPVVRPKPSIGFFRHFKEHLSGLTSVILRSQEEQQPHMRTGCVSSQPPRTVGACESSTELQIKPNYCFEIQKSVKDNQIRSNTQGSANIQGYEAVGEKVPLQKIRKNQILKE